MKHGFLGTNKVLIFNFICPVWNLFNEQKLMTIFKSIFEAESIISWISFLKQCFSIFPFIYKIPYPLSKRKIIKERRLGWAWRLSGTIRRHEKCSILGRWCFVLSFWSMCFVGRAISVTAGLLFSSQVVNLPPACFDSKTLLGGEFDCTGTFVKE